MPSSQLCDSVIDPQFMRNARHPYNHNFDFPTTCVIRDGRWEVSARDCLPNRMETAGACASILKDAETRELLGAIRTVAEGGRHIPSMIAQRLADRAMSGPSLTEREVEVLRFAVAEAPFDPRPWGRGLDRIDQDRAPDPSRFAMSHLDCAFITPAPHLVCSTQSPILLAEMPSGLDVW